MTNIKQTAKQYSKLLATIIVVTWWLILPLPGEAVAKAIGVLIALAGLYLAVGFIRPSVVQGWKGWYIYTAILFTAISSIALPSAYAILVGIVMSMFVVTGAFGGRKLITYATA